ncbi:amino acid ABC transporter substrate-binding protein [Kistimonas asteriae]|uniref:amino acid ABC transporter substrate-binding protein n=1 Tax=Kistimonas asteriae TaxID=517724 RepID=UPI001BA9E682|nr:amino acid ABC transporter substrate-binding protein [Kistimonas asteriae]
MISFWYRIAALMFVILTPLTAWSDTLATVKERGFLRCGVHPGLPGFASQNDQGLWQGFDVDFCRAVAAAVLRDADAVRFIPLDAQERFTALQSGAIDLLSRNTTWTLSRDTALGLDFAGISYHDGQGFLVWKKQRIRRATELDDASICVIAGTTTELNLADWFQQQGQSYRPVVMKNYDAVASAFRDGRCDVVTSDQSQLYALRLRLKKPTNAVVLPDMISKEPLGPVVRQGDDQWFNIVRWILAALINGEELGLAQKTIAQRSRGPAVERFLEMSIPADSMGLPKDWTAQVISQVGNYGEIFERNLGILSPLLMDRSLNALWRDGGILYAPPFR